MPVQMIAHLTFAFQTGAEIPQNQGVQKASVRGLKKTNRQADAVLNQSEPVGLRRRVMSDNPARIYRFEN